MKSRVAVAIVGIPLVYILTWASWQHALLFTLLVCAAATIAAGELYAMLREHGPYVPAGMIAAALMPLAAWRAFEPGIFAVLLATIPLSMIFAGLSAPRKQPAVSVAVTIFGVAYIAVSASLIDILRTSPHGFGLILLLLAGTWVSDSGAYIVGRAIGKHKLSPRISPNKTIEGFVGGTVVGTFVVWYAHYLTTYGPSHKHQLWLSGGHAVLIGLAISLAATLGDLFESLLKRAAGVKDSAHLLGEHGGMLDRIDALLVAGPILYIAAFGIGLL